MTIQNVTRIRRSPLSESLDVLLADVAIRIQLTRTTYRKTEERYETLGRWIDRDGSPLARRVQLVYLQGSIAIGATIASRLTTDEHDVDFIAQLDLPLGTPPQAVLDLLYESIRGERDSLYHDMTERRNRCVTVHYADKMHADITPMIRLPGRPERESHLFHNKPEAPAEPDLTLVANPFGFAEWFKVMTPLDHEFAAAFARRAYEFDVRFRAEKADSEDMPEQEPVYRKSKAVIVLQLMKRWRNVQYDRRETRRPPSVMMSKLIADAANGTVTLSEELLRQARAMRDELNRWHRAGLLIHVVNPACAEDILTDRWPSSLSEQAVFIADLDDLVTRTERLIAGCSLQEMKAIMIGLFGEAPTGGAFELFNKQIGESITSGRSHHAPGAGRFSLPASGLITGVAAPTGARATPRNTFYGMERRTKR